MKIETKCFGSYKEKRNNIWVDFMEDVAFKLSLEGWVGFSLLALDRSTLLNEQSQYVQVIVFCFDSSVGVMREGRI